MPGTEWVADLTVAKLKDELKKRGQPVVGKKAELAERLEAYVKEHEVGGPRMRGHSDRSSCTKQLQVSCASAALNWCCNAGHAGRDGISTPSGSSWRRCGGR